MLLLSIYNLIRKTYYIIISLMLNLLYLVKNVGKNSHEEKIVLRFHSIEGLLMLRYVSLVLASNYNYCM